MASAVSASSAFNVLRAAVISRVMLASVDAFPELVINLVKLTLRRLDSSFEIEERGLRCTFLSVRRNYNFFRRGDFLAQRGAGTVDKLLELLRQSIEAHGI